jgi:TolB protein
VGIAGSQAKSPNDAAYFVAWIDRLIEAAKAHKDWNADTEKETVINQLHQARQIYSSETR